MAARAWWKMPFAIVLTAIMLFPVYWMVNVSLTNRASIRKNQFFPFDFTVDHYRVVLEDQVPFLATSLVVGIGTVILTIAIAAPAGYALARLPVPWGRPLGFILIVAQMVPAVVMALGFYSIYNKLGLLNTVHGLILADSTIAVPFAVMLFTAFMRGIPDEISRGRRGRWRFNVAALHVDRFAALSQLMYHGGTVRLPVGVVGLSVRVDAGSRGW